MIPDYVQERTIICGACPLFDIFNNMCSPSLYLNPETNDVSTYQKEGYIRGCGCHLKWKIAGKKSKCPAGKWPEYSRN